MSAVRFVRTFKEQVADRLAVRLLERLEDENALPLPFEVYDVLVDDPGHIGRHELTVSAVSPRAAAVEACKEAIRRVDFRLFAAQPHGDEQSAMVARDLASMYCTVHRAGEHPRFAPEKRTTVSTSDGDVTSRSAAST